MGFPQVVVPSRTLYLLQCGVLMKHEDMAQHHRVAPLTLFFILLLLIPFGSLLLPLLGVSALS